MKPRHLTLMHGGRCPCDRCRFEAYATAVLLVLAIAVLAGVGFWLDAQWIRWVTGR